MFVESLGSATLHNGIIRIECKMRSGLGKDEVTGQLVIPALTAIPLAQQLGAILTEMGRRLEETRKAGTDKAGGDKAGATATAPASAGKDKGKA